MTRVVLSVVFKGKINTFRLAEEKRRVNYKNFFSDYILSSSSSNLACLLARGWRWIDGRISFQFLVVFFRPLLVWLFFSFFPTPFPLYPVSVWPLRGRKAISRLRQLEEVPTQWACWLGCSKSRSKPNQMPPPTSTTTGGPKPTRKKPVILMQALNCLQHTLRVKLLSDYCTIL